MVTGTRHVLIVNPCCALKTTLASPQAAPVLRGLASKKDSILSRIDMSKFQSSTKVCTLTFKTGVLEAAHILEQLSQST